MMKALCRLVRSNEILRGLVAFQFDRRAWIICTALEGRTNGWLPHFNLSWPFNPIISKPHLATTNSSPWRSHIFVDIFMAKVASDTQSHGVELDINKHIHMPKNVYKLEGGWGTLDSSLEN